MSAAARMSPRYGSASEVAALTGLSLRTVRRRVKDGTLRGVKLGRRVLIPFEDLSGDGPRPREPRLEPPEATSMATVPTRPATAGVPLVPPLSAEELTRRNRALVELLDSWESEGDEQEQRETLGVIREALGAKRVASSRNLFP
jgi:excisionase family DNA binding protein